MSDSGLRAIRLMRIRLLLLAVFFTVVRTAAFSQPSADLLYMAITRDVPADKYVYNWRDAVLLKSLTDVYRSCPEQRESIASYVQEAMYRVAPNAHGIHPNGIASAVGFAFLQEIGRNTVETDAALERVIFQYNNMLRTADGACSHRADRVELWDDTLYMLDMTLVGCYRATGDTRYLDMLANEIILHSKRLFDSHSGLWYHAWAQSDVPVSDECGQDGWNCNPQHRNSEFWGRGNGRIAMALVDVLEYLPKSSPHYKQLKGMFCKMMKSLRRVQDDSGMWYQLPAHPGDAGNYLESSCTAMFGYAAAKGSRLGLLTRRYSKMAWKSWSGIKGGCLKYEPDGVYLTRICPGTCVGDKDYYYSRGVVACGESYALGAAIMLWNEIENY